MNHKRSLEWRLTLQRSRNNAIAMCPQLVAAKVSLTLGRSPFMRINFVMNHDIHTFAKMFLRLDNISWMKFSHPTLFTTINCGTEVTRNSEFPGCLLYVLFLSIYSLHLLLKWNKWGGARLNFLMAKCREQIFQGRVVGRGEKSVNPKDIG